jgi:hypothetical protein
MRLSNGAHLTKKEDRMNVNLTNVAIEPLLALLIGILILLVPTCAQVFKLFRGRVSDCRWYPGADASIASREEVLRPPQC